MARSDGRVSQSSQWAVRGESSTPERPRCSLFERLPSPTRMDCSGPDSPVFQSSAALDQAIEAEVRFFVEGAFFDE